MSAGPYCLIRWKPATCVTEQSGRVWRDVAKLPPRKNPDSGVVSHTGDIFEHPEEVVDHIGGPANLPGRENIIAGPDCGLGRRPHQLII